MTRVSPVVREHPSDDELVHFMRGKLSRPKVALIVRHLLSGCTRCPKVTRRLWELGDETLDLESLA
jgi:hypothetical protein